MAYVNDRGEDQGFGIIPVAAVAAAAPGIMKAIGGLAKPKTIAAAATPPGYRKLAQDGGSFSLSAQTEVLVLAPNGTSATQVLGPGTYPCSTFLGRDLQKGASKICAARENPATLLSSIGITQITGGPPTTLAATPTIMPTQGALASAVAATGAPSTDPFAAMLAAISGYGNTGAVGASQTALPAVSQSYPVAAAPGVMQSSMIPGVSNTMLMLGGVAIVASLLLNRRK